MLLIKRSPLMNRKMYENLIFGVKYEKYRFIFFG